MIYKILAFVLCFNNSWLGLKLYERGSFRIGKFLICFSEVYPCIKPFHYIIPTVAIVLRGAYQTDYNFYHVGDVHREPMFATFRISAVRGEALTLNICYLG